MILIKNKTEGLSYSDDKLTIIKLVWDYYEKRYIQTRRNFYEVVKR